MTQDILDEEKERLVDSKAFRKAVGKITVKLFQQFLKTRE